VIEFKFEEHARAAFRKVKQLGSFLEGRRFTVTRRLQSINEKTSDSEKSNSDPSNEAGTQEEVKEEMPA